MDPVQQNASQSTRGRRSSTCAGKQIAETEWCNACANPKKKRKCLLQRGDWSTVPPQSASSFNNGQQSKQLPEYQPDDFRRPQQNLPPVPTRKGTQLARTVQLASERNVALEARVREEVVRLSETVLNNMQVRMTAMHTELVQLRTEVAKQKQLARQAESKRRQSTLDAFFRNPLQHQVRPCTVPAELGEGYTARNIASGCFAQHVKAIEDHIIGLGKDDPLKQLQVQPPPMFTHIVFTSIPFCFLLTPHTHTCRATRICCCASNARDPASTR